jgi:hypothetical protein
MQKIRLLFLLLLAKLVMAEGGFYVGVGAGYSSLTGTVQSPYQFTNTSSSSQTAGSFASQLYFGYDFYHWLGIQFDYNAAWGANYTNSYSLNQQLLGGSVLFHLPFSIFSDSLSGISAYTKLGYDYNAINFGNTNSCNGCTNLNNAAYGYTPLFGLGAEWGLKNVGYRLEWDYSGGLMAQNNSGNNLVSTSSNSFLASIMYHF